MAAAACTSFSSLHLSTSFLTRHCFPFNPSRRNPLSSLRCSALPRITSEFNITFAPPSKPKPSTETPPLSFDPDSGPLFIPWIVRDEKGNLAFQANPPARLLHQMANAKTMEKKKNPKKQKPGMKAMTTAAVAEPKHSKAARRFYNQNFRELPQRLSKVLAAAGVASRRSSEELIFEGRVTVNGSVCNTPQTRVDPAKDIIYVNGSRLSKKLPPKVYLALNKPKGYICSSGEKESKSVMCLFDDYLKSWDKRNPGLPKPRLFTVGRLDVATTGLIIVTNDGDFAQRLSHPSSNLSKEYIATIDGAVSKRHLVAISEGVVIEGTRCIPDAVDLLPKQPDISRSRLRIVVHEGRNHEVRELVKNAGLTIHSLKRIRIAGFRLPSDLGFCCEAKLLTRALLSPPNPTK